MSYTLVLNSSNVSSSSNSVYIYNFIGGNFTVSEDAEICVSNITIPYSWYNISSVYNNKSFQFTWTVGTITTTYNVTLPNGFYLTSDINQYLELYCQQHGFYLINSSGEFIYYLQLLENVNYYKIQLLSYVVPTSLPSGWTQPSNFAGYPSVATAPSFIVLSNDFTKLIGFNPGTYGGGSSDSSTLSQFTPNGSPVNSVVVRCSLVNNSVGFPTDILDSFPITSQFGSNINYDPKFEKWLHVQPGTYNKLIITFVDQNFANIPINDSNVCITFPCPEKISVKKEFLSEWQQEDYHESKITKLYTTFNDKLKYVVNYRYLQLVLSLGVELKGVHRVLEFDQKPFLKSYIDLNTNLRKKASNDFEKDFFKLMNNSVFGKTMENVRNRINFRLVSTEEEAWRVKNLNRFTIFDESLVGVHIQKKSIQLNKPVYLGQTILDDSKYLMYDFHYNFMLKKIPRDCIDLLFTDTDSLCYRSKSKEHDSSRSSI
jgi:hypothetical protein